MSARWLVAAAVTGLGAAVPPPLPHGFTADQVRRILQHSPLPAPPRDTSNARADDPAAARLGHFLFFEPRLSGNGHLSCASCHDPERGFTDGKALSEGARPGRRNTPALWNVAYNRWFFWDGRADSLWSQALKPMENEEEMAGNRTAVFRLVRDDARLRAAYEAIFGAFPAIEDRASINRVFVAVGKALAAHQRRIVSRGAPFDVFAAGLRDGDPARVAALSDSARRGLEIFVGRGQCRTCHAGPNFTDGEFHDIGVPPRTGLPLDAGRPEGVTRLTRDEFQAGGSFSDDRDGDAARGTAFLDPSAAVRGQVKTPSLRNVATTAPYMHQGQLATLADVVRYYSTLAGRTPPGPDDEKILAPLGLDDGEMADLVAFLESLTGRPLPAELLRPPPSPR